MSNDMDFESQYKDFWEIPNVEFPISYMPILKTFSSKIVEAVERDGPPIETGAIDIGGLNENEKLVYLFFFWINSTNSSIDNMNIVLADLSQLGENYLAFRGPPRVRFYLLIKTFFNEVYRLRDILNQFLSGLNKLGKIEKAEIKGAREAFSVIFDASVDIRNSMVHGHPGWSGKGHFDMNFVLGSAEIGVAFKDKKTGKVWKIQDVLKENVEVFLKAMIEEGLCIQRFLSKFSETASEMYSLS
ncbi:hypothetical protein [Marinobacterium litorale]|uniref:hypothetical protein n=1 Tax=Marinobacterium litorale TaxID=404770 RepID=UPI0004863199|nr:hypothetical protein [Marinobacterium litorale]